ncbi:MAG: DUF1573 domain-containing protein [Saprospiraceae bacterium]|nr:DUF1573 domain-containing protein [Saprospiraceae bacterium]
MPLILSFLMPFFLLSEALLQWTTPTQHDFGEIKKGDEAQHIFTFKNVSDQPIVLDNVRTECSCTASDWSKTPILPNETGRITVSFDAKQTGYFRKKITVWVRGQRKPEKLSIEGEVY